MIVGIRVFVVANNPKDNGIRYGTLIKIIREGIMKDQHGTVIDEDRTTYTLNLVDRRLEHKNPYIINKRAVKKANLLDTFYHTIKTREDNQ